jgi:hypothetical protein
LPSRIRPALAGFGGADQVFFGELEAFGHALTGFDQGALGGIEVLIAGATTDT